MTTADDTYDDDLDDDPPAQAPRDEDPDIQQLRKSHKRLPKERAAREAAEKERDDAKRELLLLKAGIDVSTGTGKLFAKAYDGDLTVEAMQAAAAEYGLAEAPVQGAPPEAVQAQRAIQQGATTPSANPGPSSQITPADFAGPEKADDWMRFMAEHPDHADKLLQGEAVPRPAGW